jgi:hypothetical protein
MRNHDKCDYETSLIVQLLNEFHEKKTKKVTDKIGENRQFPCRPHVQSAKPKFKWFKGYGTYHLAAEYYRSDTIPIKLNSPSVPASSGAIDFKTLFGPRPSNLNLKILNFIYPITLFSFFACIIIM